jgi:hypothetical protein
MSNRAFEAALRSRKDQHARRVVDYRPSSPSYNGAPTPPPPLVKSTSYVVPREMRGRGQGSSREIDNSRAISYHAEEQPMGPALPPPEHKKARKHRKRERDLPYRPAKRPMASYTYHAPDADERPEQFDMAWVAAFTPRMRTTLIPIYTLGVRDFPVDTLTVGNFAPNLHRLSMDTQRQQVKCVLRVMMHNLYGTLSLFNVHASKAPIPTFDFRQGPPRGYSVGAFDSYARCIGSLQHPVTGQLALPFCRVAPTDMATPAVIKRWAQRGGSVSINPWVVFDDRLDGEPIPFELPGEDEEAVEEWARWNLRCCTDCVEVIQQAALFIRNCDPQSRLGFQSVEFDPKLVQQGQSHLWITTNVLESDEKTTEIHAWSQAQFTALEAQHASHYKFGQLPRSRTSDGPLRPKRLESNWSANADQMNALVPQLLGLHI